MKQNSGGKNNKLCYEQISLYKDTKQVYLEKHHSNFCDDLYKNNPENLAEVDNEINKRIFL